MFLMITVSLMTIPCVLISKLYIRNIFLKLFVSEVVWPIFFKVFLKLNLLQYCFWFFFFFFYVLAFWLQGMWDLSSLTRDQTHTPCIGRWSLNHRTAREVPMFDQFLSLERISTLGKISVFVAVNKDFSYVAFAPGIMEGRVRRRFVSDRLSLQNWRKYIAFRGQVGKVNILSWFFKTEV